MRGREEPSDTDVTPAVRRRNQFGFLVLTRRGTLRLNYLTRSKSALLLFCLFIVVVVVCFVGVVAVSLP